MQHLINWIVFEPVGLSALFGPSNYYSTLVYLLRHKPGTYLEIQLVHTIIAKEYILRTTASTYYCQKSTYNWILRKIHARMYCHENENVTQNTN